MRRKRPISYRWFRLVVLGMAALLLPLATPACHAWYRANHDAKRQIELLEEQWRAAQLSGDTSTLDKMLSDDYVGITMSGEVNTKTQQLSRIRNRVFTLSRLDLSDMKVKLLGQVAIVTVMASVEGTNDGKHMSGNFRYTRVYQHLPGGGWKITNFEATKIRPRNGETQFQASAGKAS